MTTPMRNHMRRSTRPAKFVSRSHQAESMAWGRPGNSSFSFSGEFPTMGDQQPVEACSSRRVYTSSRMTGGYRPVGRDDMQHMPAINKYGVQCGTGLVMLAVLLVVLGGIFMARFDVRGQIIDAIARSQDSINTLETKCTIKQNDIDALADSMNIRKEALRIGLISSRGVQVEYLDAPVNAVITQTDQTAIQALASIWGN